MDRPLSDSGSLEEKFARVVILLLIWFWPFLESEGQVAGSIGRAVLPMSDDTWGFHINSL